MLGAPLGAAALLALPAPLRADEQPLASSVYVAFPRQDPERVRETVLYAHSDIEKVEKLVTASPALANASMDWGFGDWETAIGAASHMGRRDMAELLLSHGARPDLFTQAMLGNLGAVRAAVEARPGIQGALGPHGFTLLFHARAGREPAAAVVAYLEEVGGADPDPGLEPLPLPAEAYHGVYAWGPEAFERLEVFELRGGLGIRRLAEEKLGRSASFGRSLRHLGDHAFYPAGARAVGVRFTVEGERPVAVTVSDPEPLVVARRV